MSDVSLISLALIFVFGAVLGSFTNVVIHRLPRHQSLVFPGSRCPQCGAPIRPVENIPIVSFLLLRGRCRSCGQRIAWRYPVVELAAGVMLAVLWVHELPVSRGSSIAFVREFTTSAIFALMLLAVFFIDLEHRIVPNAISYPGLALGLLLAIPQGRFVNAVVSAAGAGLLFLLIAVVSRGGMGGGDVKLAAMLGAFLGWPAIAVALLLAFALGAGVGILLIVVGRGSRKTPIPFGPALALGAVVALVAAGPIVRWYLGQ